MILYWKWCRHKKLSSKVMVYGAVEIFSGKMPFEPTYESKTKINKLPFNLKRQNLNIFIECSNRFETKCRRWWNNHWNFKCCELLRWSLFRCKEDPPNFRGWFKNSAHTQTLTHQFRVCNFMQFSWIKVSKTSGNGAKAQGVNSQVFLKSISILPFFPVAFRPLTKYQVTNWYEK